MKFVEITASITDLLKKMNHLYEMKKKADVSKNQKKKKKKINNDKNESQKSIIFHDNQKTYNKTDIMSKDISKIQLCHKTLQKKEQCISRCVKSMIRFNIKRKKIRNSIIKNE